MLVDEPPQFDRLDADTARSNSAGPEYTTANQTSENGHGQFEAGGGVLDAEESIERSCRRSFGHADRSFYSCVDLTDQHGPYGTICSAMSEAARHTDRLSQRVVTRSCRHCGETFVAVRHQAFCKPSCR